MIVLDIETNEFLKYRQFHKTLREIERPLRLQKTKVGLWFYRLYDFHFKPNR